MRTKEVVDRRTLAEYVRWLAADIEAGNRKCGSVDVYLEALSGWIEDMDGYFANQGEPVPDAPSWQLVAMMLTAATVYE